MKKFVCLIICVVIAFAGAVTAFADSIAYENVKYGFSVTLPDGFLVIDRSTLSKNSEFIEKIGYSVESFSAKLEQSNIVMYAADRDNSRQVQVKHWESDFSKGIGNLSALDDERLATALATMAKPLSADGNSLINSAIGEVGNSVYLCYTVQVDGKFCYTEYITVVNGYCYSLVYYNSSAEFSAEEIKERDAVIAALSISGAESDSIWGSYGLSLRLISAVLLIAAVVFAVYLISSFVRDIRNRHNSPEVIPDHIKMKYK